MSTQSGRLIRSAFAALAVAAVLLVACSGGDDDSEEASANDVSSGICAEGTEDCDEPAGARTAAASPQPRSDPASCADQPTSIARRDLAARLGVEADAVALVSCEAVAWPDACLDAPKPGTACAQVITPGFKVVLESAGAQYEYHTDNGTRAVRVE